jgi:hypothetical protein
MQLVLGCLPIEPELLPQSLRAISSSDSSILKSAGHSFTPFKNSYLHFKIFEIKLHFQKMQTLMITKIMM